MTGLLEAHELLLDVVSLDVRHRQVEAVTAHQLAGCLCQPSRVQPTRVDDQLRAIGGELIQRRLQVPHERGGVAGRRVLLSGLAEDQHRDLGEVVTRDDVDVAQGNHLDERIVSVTVEPRAVPDPDRTRAALGGSGSLLRDWKRHRYNLSPAPGWRGR